MVSKYQTEVVLVSNHGVLYNWIDIPYISDAEKMALYYSAADIFIYPSMVEAFGLVIAEAMACETPVVAFDNSAISEIIKHKETGYLAKNKDIQDFINGINFFIENKEQRLNIGAEARKSVIENFTIQKMLDSYISLYNEVFEKRKSITQNK